MNNEITIRKADLNDIEILVEFNKAMAFETEKMELSTDVLTEGVKNLMDHPEHGFYLIAESNDQVAGSLMITTEWSDWRNGLFWWIQSVYVKHEFRRQGVYSALYDKVKYLSEEDENVRGYRLYVDRNNTIARKTYSALGMEKTNYRLYEELK